MPIQVGVYHKIPNRNGVIDQVHSPEKTGRKFFVVELSTTF